MLRNGYWDFNKHLGRCTLVQDSNLTNISHTRSRYRLGPVGGLRTSLGQLVDKFILTHQFQSYYTQQPQLRKSCTLINSTYFNIQSSRTVSKFLQAVFLLLKYRLSM